jgi:hypothetical protein
VLQPKNLGQAKCWLEINWLGWIDIGEVGRTAERASPATETGMQMTRMVRKAVFCGGQTEESCRPNETGVAH